MITIDFETEAIVGNPIVNPPLPVGVAVKYDAAPAVYYAWGHPTENNSTLEEATAALRKAFHTGDDLLFHNAPFDVSILIKYFGFKLKDPLRIYDTQYAIFLHNPYAASFALKPAAEQILGIAPEERDLVREWVVANVPEARQKPSTWGAYISKAPGGLVGPYAIGDVDRTYALHVHLYKMILEQSMLVAYRREQMLMPVLMESSRRGIRVDRARLGRDIELYEGVLAHVSGLIHRRLGTYDLNLDSDQELADALERAGLISEWIYTEKGARSVARKNLAHALNDPEILGLLSYRGALSTCLGTFARPWYEMSAADGRLHTEWNQVRGDRSSRDVAGTRTGRLSSMRPNFQNVPNEFPDPPPGLPPHLVLRAYLLPEVGHVWLKRDFSAQEMRILAHFTEGKLFQAFNEDPATDPHAVAQRMVYDITTMDLPRKFLKIIAFGIMYGRGIPNLSAALEVSIERGTEVRDAYFAAFPEVRALSNSTRNRGRAGAPIRTWGGRLYSREPHPTRDLSYKLLNYLIQGSAADQTKQSIVDWHYTLRGPDDVFLATVHDENNISAPADSAPDSMRRLRESMDAPRFDVPFRSEGFIGPNWADIKECE